MVDVNVWLGAWPFQYFQLDTARRLQNHLADEGIAQAFVGSPEAAFNADCAATNRLLLKRLDRVTTLHPVLALDPTKGDWKDILAMAGDEGAAAVRLFPNYHCYELDSPAAIAAVEEIAAAGKLALFVQMRMEDERTHHLMCKIPGVQVAAVSGVARRFAALPMVAVCAYYHEAVELTRQNPNLRVELSHVETLRTVATLLGEAPQERILFGSHTPFLQTRAAVMKVIAPYVSEAARRSLAEDNTRGILGSALGA